MDGWDWWWCCLRAGGWCWGSGRESNKKGGQGQTGEKRREEAGRPPPGRAGQAGRQGVTESAVSSAPSPSIEGREEEATYKQARPSWDGPKPISALHRRAGGRQSV
jgi:hypothetical protein